MFWGHVLHICVIGRTDRQFFYYALNLKQFFLRDLEQLVEENQVVFHNLLNAEHLFLQKKFVRPLPKITATSGLILFVVVKKIFEDSSIISFQARMNPVTVRQELMF